jgi:hypothetical protein
MPYNNGDVVQVQLHSASGRGRARVQSVLEQRPVMQDFQEYVVEFDQFRSERFRFGLYREFEMLPDLPPIGVRED